MNLSHNIQNLGVKIKYTDKIKALVARFIRHFIFATVKKVILIIIMLLIEVIIYKGRIWAK